MSVTSNINGDITVNGVYVGNFNTNPSLMLMSEAELLEGAQGEIIPLHRGPDTGPSLFDAQDAPGGPVRDPLLDPDDETDTDPGFWSHDFDFWGHDHDLGDALNAVTQPIIDIFPDWEERGDQMAGEGSYGNSNAAPSMCKLALMNKALIAIVQAGAVTSAGNPLLGVVGSILNNGLQRLGVGRDWGRRIFGGSQDADVCQRIVEEAIAVGYLRIPKPNEDGSLPGRMQITLDPDSPRATLQWRRKPASTTTRRRTYTRRAPARRTYRRRT